MKIKTQLCLIFFSLLCACGGDINEKQKVVISQRKFIDSIYLSDLKGTRINLREFKGKVIFLNFWATWCRPCRQEMPSIARASKLLAKKDLVFILASTEESDEIIAFKDRNKYDFSFAVLGNAEGIGIEALPTTMIFDVDGNLHFCETGSKEWDDPKSLEIIKKLLQ